MGDWWQRAKRPFFIVLAASIVVSLLLITARQFELGRNETTNYIFVLLIGATVGATELMSRYRDAPFQPLLSIPGMLYMVVNAGAAILAYYLLGILAGPLSDDGDKDAVYRVLLAGLSAMAFFRSGIFTIRMGDSDVAVGPNLILQILLSALDRTYDRIRATPRSECASSIMAGVEFELAKEALPSFCLSLMQNVAQSERLAVAAEVKALAEATTMSAEAKSLNLGLTLLNVVGEKTLEAAVGALGGTIRGTKPLSVEILAALATLDPARVVSLLPAVVRVLSGSRIRDVADSQLLEIEALVLPVENKAAIMTHVLVRHYGEKIVGAALLSMDEG